MVIIAGMTVGMLIAAICFCFWTLVFLIVGIILLLIAKHKQNAAKIVLNIIGNISFWVGMIMLTVVLIFAVILLL